VPATQVDNRNNIERTLQHLPGAIEEIVAAQVDKRVDVVRAVASQLECGTTRWTNHLRGHVTAQIRAARRVAKILLLRTTGNERD
jgi:hypothetical protein